GRREDRRATGRLQPANLLPQGGRHKDTAARRPAAEMPLRGFRVPGAVPAEPVAENQAAFAMNGQLLNECGELKLLGIVPARVAAGKPDVGPDDRCAFSQFYAGALIITAALKRDRRAWQEHQYGTGLDRNIPLLRGKAVETGMNSCRRLPGDHGAGAGAG